ncbi:MAG: hypothetical protein U0325_03310 [Polyangiales bacterium]
MNVEVARAWLESSGCAVHLRHVGWFECLVSAPGERWVGSGASEREALDDALAKMFPSALSRALLLDALARTAAPEAGNDAPANEAHATPIDAASSVAEAPPPANEVARTTKLASVPCPPPAPAPERAALPQPPAPRRVLDPEADASLERLDELLEEVGAREEQLSMATPVRQRLVITGWIADARRAQDLFPDEERVRTHVARIASRLSRLCRVWWCGSARALQADRRPEGVISELPYPCDLTPQRWDEVAELARAMLERLERDDLRAGRDEYGWSDGDRLTPAPRDPEALLREVIAGIEGVAGNAETFPPRGQPEPKLLARWAARLRWLRGTGIDGAQWAYAVGRCRHWIGHDRAAFAEAEALLDPGYRPEAAWAALLAAPGKDRDRRRLVKEVFTQAPAVKDHPDPDAVLAWLRRALPLADTHHRQIVEAVTPFREGVLGLEAATLPGLDRRLRRRLLILQRDLGGTMTVPEGAEEPEEADTTEAASDSAEPDAPPLQEAVRSRTRGTRALFISNRNDPLLHDRLLKALSFAQLDWCEADVKRAQAAEQKVAGGGYDFVLAATGFLSHSVDGRIAKVCRARQIPYVRVERGRPLTCVRSLARDLGIHA